MQDPSDVEQAVERAMRRLVEDDELHRRFWAVGYKRLAEHASDGASQWLGKRLMISLVWALVGAGLAWLVKSGAIK